MTDDRRPDQADPTPPAGDAGAPAVPQWAPTSGAPAVSGGVWSARPSQPARRSVLPEQTAADPVPNALPTRAPVTAVTPESAPVSSPVAAPVPPSVPAPTAPAAQQPVAAPAPLSPYAAASTADAPPASAFAPRTAERPPAPAPVTGPPSPLPSRASGAGAGAAPDRPVESTATSGWAIVDPQTAPASSAPTLGVSAVSAVGPAGPVGAASVAGPPLTVPGSSTPVARATGTTGAPEGAAPGDAGGASSGGRPRWLLPVSIGAGVLLVGGVVAGVLASRSGADDAPAAVASTVLLPSPTPTIDPVAREATTPFATLLPASLLQYALTGSVTNDAWLASGALEAYTDTYDDGAGAQVVVGAGQWETAEEAAAFAQQAIEALNDTAAQPADEPSADATATTGTSTAAEPRSGDVVVGGQTVGSYLVADQGDGTSVAVWWNGTTVFQVTGPTADIDNLYAAYPL